MDVVRCESRTARHARFVSADLDQARIGHPRSQACEACGGTALRPTLATPRERAPRRAGMHNDIAQLRNLVKNKARTLNLTQSCHSRKDTRRSHRRGRESMVLSVIVDPLPALRAPGMTPPHHG